MRNQLFRFVDMSSQVLATIAGLVVFTMFLIIMAEIIARAVFNAPITWALDIVEGLMIPGAYLGIAYACREEAHVGSTFLQQKLSAKWKKPLHIFILFVMLAFAIFFTMRSYELFTNSYIVKSSLVSQRIPVYPFAFAAALAGLGTVLQLLVLIMRAFISKSSELLQEVEHND